MRGQNAAAKPFNVSQIEGEVHEAVLHRPPHIQAVEPMPRAPSVPDYVNHREDATEIGKLSAEAIVREYEVTAKEIEAVGEFVKEMAQRCEQLTTSTPTNWGRSQSCVCCKTRDNTRRPWPWTQAMHWRWRWGMPIC